MRRKFSLFLKKVGENRIKNAENQQNVDNWWIKCWFCTYFPHMTVWLEI
jgi:hypothetical protein